MSAIFRCVYAQPLYRVIIIMLVFIVSWGLINKKCFGKHGNIIVKKLNIFLCVLAVALIFSTTICFRTIEIREVCFVPFYSFVLAKQQPELYRSMLMNVFLFVPFGLAMPYLLGGKSKQRVMETVLYAMFFSVVIEVIQYILHIGRAEIDDVICNTLGATVGCFSYLISVILKTTKNTTIETNSKSDKLCEENNLWKK